MALLVLVSVSVTVTFTPAITAPEGSVTVPRTVPRSVPCPKPDLATTKDKTKNKNTTTVLLLTENLPRHFPWTGFTTIRK
jgi:hypothetical protein